MLLAPILAAEAARRLLSPGPPPLAPRAVQPHEYFTAEEVARGARFARPQLALALGREAVAGATLVGAVLASRRRRLPAWALGRGPLAGGAIVAGGLTTALTAAGLPLAAIARRRALAVGLVTQSWRGWAGDLVKATAIEAALSGAAGAATVAVTRRYPRGWWLPLAAGAAGLGAGIGALAPVLLDPLFNRFDPLPEGETRSDVLALAAAAGARVGEVYRVDASRRTTGANAYVTGLGPSKRVVLFDTLLSSFGRDEVRVVVAHELAHVRGGDVLRGVAFTALTAPAAALAVQRLSWWLSPHRGTPEAIPALALAGAVVLAPVSLVGTRLARALERRADHFSLELSRAPEAFVSFERRIALQNVADLDPPRWVSRLLATHPPTLERIGAALAFAEACG